MEFNLGNRKPRPWQIPNGVQGKFVPMARYGGDQVKIGQPLEVVVARSESRPATRAVRNLWGKWRNGRATRVLLVVLWREGGKDRASVVGVSGEKPAVHEDLDPRQVQRLVSAALDEPDAYAAERFFDKYLRRGGSGVLNHGLLSRHHLENRIPQRPDWDQRCAEAEPLLGLRGADLIARLGYRIEQHGQGFLLRSGDNASAVAVMLDKQETPDLPLPRLNNMTPIAWALASAAQIGVPYVIVTRSHQVRVHLVGSRPGGVARAGGSTFVELSLPLLTRDNAGLLPLLFSADSLKPGGEFERLLAETESYAVDLGSRLRERVYGDAVPGIAAALVKQHDGGTTEGDLASLYNRTLLILFRLMFVAYAEDRDLLPIRTNGLYAERSLKRIATELADQANQHGRHDIPFDPQSTSLWDRVAAIWRAVDQGNRDWGVPIYNGGMFSSDPVDNPDGALLAVASVPDDEFGPSLAGLLIEPDPDTGRFGPVDFASMDVREFGTLYEGLLESNLAVADVDLKINKEGTYLPATPGVSPAVKTGDIYLHNRSGARKSSGAYFTKPFAVAHLLDRALDEALNRHIERLTQCLADGRPHAEKRAAEAFFDIRVADIAMGSGHFLVAAVDRIQARLAAFLADHRLPAVTEELHRLARSASAALEEVGVHAEQPDTDALLRRQIARRCIYGVDLNPTAVELARMALWLHTFVPGLPLASLNHGLIAGDALTGIATLDEAAEILDPETNDGATSFVRLAIQEALETAHVALRRFAATGEATIAEVKEAGRAHREATRAVEEVQTLLDYAVAIRTGETPAPDAAFDVDALRRLAQDSGASDFARDLRAAHLLVAFPEVFLRDRPGFDCLLGNPPWEKVKVERHSFWALRFPGLRGLKGPELDREIEMLEATRPDLVAEFEREQESTTRARSILALGPYRNIKGGDPDIYRNFAWRLWQVVRPGGTIGVILPRGAISGTGLKSWRAEILESGELADVTVGTNTGGWMFDDAHHSYTICLLSITKTGRPSQHVTIRSGYTSLETYQDGIREPAVPIPVADLKSWTPQIALPLIPDGGHEVFLKMRQHPALKATESFRFKPVSELHTTSDKCRTVTTPGEGRWPVYKGSSINLWDPDAESPERWVDPAAITNFLQTKRLKQAKSKNSSFYGMPDDWLNDPATLPIRAARIAFRDVARATDTRTAIATLVPAGTALVHTAPYLFRLAGSQVDEAYLLGVMSSRPFDWHARCFVEAHVTFDLLATFPIPDPPAEDPLRERVVEIAGRLAAVDDRYATWAAGVGVPVGSVRDESTRSGLLAELDALVCLLYGLDTTDAKTIFATFHRGWEYEPHLEAVINHMVRLEAAR